MVRKVGRRTKATSSDHLVSIALYVISPLLHFHRSDIDYLHSLTWVNIKVEQHLASKNHTRLASGLPGVKAGYFNKATGRWERSPPTDQEQQPAPAPTPSQPSTSLGSSIVANEHNFYCQLCKVTSCHNEETYVHSLIPFYSSPPPPSPPNHAVI